MQDDGAFAALGEEEGKTGEDMERQGRGGEGGRGGARPPSSQSTLNATLPEEGGANILSLIYPSTLPLGVMLPRLRPL